ncbi:ABC transporter substrate-binding protein [Microbacterium marinilacus]|uniref:Fe/B12 periplasmic-binding domain-containing protein n=1 Tax=Microbacterium marinilacus TaxID=415209 RepID=A0ABP7BDI8_9MICO|nr:ABC transporter substrate-binding protein [Microbacterium marinilacus]MBY0689002.1 ABC transporter substrate-binding protein [Microbacterium marinilacus]
MSRTLTRAVAVLPLVAVLALASCSSDEAAPEETEAATGASVSAHTVTTDYGDVDIPEDPQTIVVLNYALAGYLYDLDVPVTATIPEDADGQGEFSEFWADEAEAAGTEFLSWSVDGFDMEDILALEPDLIIGGGWGFPLFQAAEVYDDLSDLAPTVLVSGGYSTWQEQFEFLASDVFEQPDAYDDAVAAYEARAEEVAAAIEPPEAPSAFVAFTAEQVPYVYYADEALTGVFADVGIETDPELTDENYDPYTPGGDMFELSTEQAGQVLTQPTLFITGFNGAPVDVAAASENAVFASLPAFQDDTAFDLPHWVARADFDKTMATLDLIEEMFG